MPDAPAREQVRRAEPLPEPSFCLVLTVSSSTTQVAGDAAVADGLEDDGRGLRLNAGGTRDESVRPGDGDVRLEDNATDGALPHPNPHQPSRYARQVPVTDTPSPPVSCAEVQEVPLDCP